MSYSSIQSITLSSKDATFKETPIGGYNWTVPPNRKPPPPDPDDPPDPDAPPPPPNVSGLWKPISASSGPKWCEPLTFSQSDKSSTFTPCNCNTADFSAVTEGYYDQIENSTINCSYCSNSLGSIDWYLYTENGRKSRPITANDCCDGICDTRLNKDDYLPKIPMLNQGLLSGFVDFKYMNEFPGCNNPGLGIERYITFNGTGVSGILEKQGIILHNCELCIDWKIKECMSEIPYNELESQHQSKYLHEKSYRRSIVTSKTAGNFISLGSDLSITSLPSVEEFTAPYGFNNGTYNNLFYKGKRVGSYWKWKHDGGILMWQRYFEGKYESFISPGDFFYAKMDGPEPLVIETEEEGGGGANSTGGGGGEARKMSGCPSGLKIIDNNGEVEYILPSGSSFFYISENIYPLFKDIFDRVVAVEGVSVKRAIDIAGTLATGPQYDNITLDLFATVPYEDPRNEFAQLSGLNNHMSTGMNYGSAFDFSYVKNPNDTIKNLRHKYGQYVWIPPRTTASIELIDYEGDFLELDYDMVLDTNKIKHSTNDSSQPLSYAGPIADKAFTYNFDLMVGGYRVVSCSPSIGAYSPPEQCIVETGLLDDGKTPYTRAKYSITGVGKLVNFIGGDAKGSMFLDRLPNEFYDKYSRAVLNSADITEYCAECDSKSSYYLAGIARTLCQQDNFCDYTLADYFRGGRNFQKISDGSLIMKRNYYAQAMNARIDAIAIHPNFGSAIESRMFGLDGKKSFFKIINDDKQALRTGSIRVKFTTNDVGIKIYDIRSTPLQSDTTTSYAIRFPVNYDNLCKCPSLLPDQVQGYMTPSFIENKSYTPNVSVGSYSPRLDQYGGYSQKYLDDNFPGKNLIAENFLESLTHRIDPEYPDGRTSKGKSISLPNYHTTKWRFSTNANTITISENADLYGTSYHVVEDESGFFEERINKNWKRFTTRVEINGNSYYDQQTANFASPANIHLVNPFLEALTDGKQVLHPPTVTGGNHFFDNVWGLFGPRGDEMSSVTLTFKREEAKNSVYFNTSFMNDSGLSLDPAQFHIRSGLSRIDTSLGSTINIDNYSHINSSGLIPFDDLSRITESDTLSFVGEINNNLMRSLENIYNVDKSKKPKIYIYYNNTLYEYIDPQTHEFIYTVPSQKRTFTGPPVLYEYISNSRFSRGLPYLIPIYRKHQPYFFAKYNSITSDYYSATDIDKIFPVKKNVLVSNAAGRLLLPGVRHYFCMKTDQNIISVPIPITKVNELSVNIASAISYRSLVDFQGQLFMYIGGEYATADRNEIRNYLYMPTLESTRYFTNFCNLSFDLSSPNISSYLPNSYESLDNHSIVLYTGAGYEVSARVRSRRILVQHYLDNFRITRDKTKNFRLFTELQLESYVSPDYKYVDSINSKSNCSFVFFEAAEYSNHRDPYMLDPYTMYGDLRTYDDNLFNQPIVLSEINIDDLPIPKTQYFNNFYKLILSDLQESIDFIFIPDGLEDNGDNAISITGIKNIQYNIPQKYAIDDLNLEEKYYLDSYGQYENYLGVLDVNIFGKTFAGSKSPGVLYKVRSNRLWTNTIDNSSSDGRDYILNLNKNAILAPVSSSASSVNMYAPALPFRLKEVKRKDNYWAGSNAQTQLAKPLDDLINYSLSNLNVVQKREYPFIRYDVHSFPWQCNGELNDRCHANREGSIDLITHMAFRSGVGGGGEDQKSIRVSDLLGKKISLALSYDSGPGINFAANNFYTTIERSYDGGDSADKCMSPANRLLPQLIYDQKADAAYWAGISALSEDQKKDIVKKTDKYANEVLFRILYGEEQEYNRERLFHEEEALTYSRLVDVSYDTEAKDIYRDIPYNYDRSAEMTNFYLDHNITIYGTGGAGDKVTLKIGSNTVNLTFNGRSSTVNVDINGQAINLYLDEGRSAQKTVYDYIAVPKTAEPPQYGVIEYVGDVDGRCDISYGWRSQRFYTGDPRVRPGCSQTSIGDVLFDCPVDTNLGPVDNLGGDDDDKVEINNYISSASIAPQIIFSMSSGIAYKCEDGSIWNCAPVGSCSLYGYGTAGGYGGSDTCMEFAEYTFNGARIPYSFQSCRTKFVLDAAIGPTYQYSGGPPSGQVECPSGTYDITSACGGDGSRGYVYSLYFGCNGQGMPVSVANAFRSYCDETDDNPNPTSLARNPNAQGLPGARQPGYDKCTMETTYNCRGVMNAKVYRVSSVIAGGGYTPPVCPIALVNISYNTNSINIKLANNEETYCKDINPIKQCEVTSLTLPNDKYYFTESIESECDSDKHTPNLALLDQGTQYFLTRDVKLAYGIGSYSAADINSAPPILWGRDAVDPCDRGTGPGFAWVGVGLCGVPDEGPWIGPKGIEDHKGLAGSALGEFINRIGTLAKVKNTAGSDQVVNINAERARWAGGVNYRGWVLRGPIGEGSVVFSTVTGSYPKQNKAGGGEFTLTTINAFVRVPYRIPLSVASAISAEDSEGNNPSMCGSAYDVDIRHPFPDWYGDLVGARKLDDVLGEPSSARVFSENFAILNSNFRLDCNGLQSNYNDNILSDTIAIRPCALTDYACWIKQSWVETINRNWRTVE